MIRAENIHKSFGDLHVLQGIDLEIEKGEVVSIVGASGAGKSTLLHILGTLDRADRGKIFYDNTEVIHFPQRNSPHSGTKTSGLFSSFIIFYLNLRHW